MAESAYDRKRKIPGYEHTTFVDRLKAAFMPNQLRRNMNTGEVSDEQTEFLEERAKQRKREAEAKKAGR